MLGNVDALVSGEAAGGIARSPAACTVQEFYAPGAGASSIRYG